MAAGTDRFDPIAGEPVVTGRHLVRATLGANDARKPGDREDGFLVMKEMVVEGREFAPGDVVRRLKERAQRVDLVDGVVDAVLQNQAVALGPLGEFLRREVL